MTDWFHSTTFTANAAAIHAAGPPLADNILVNGSMTSSAGGKYAETILTPGKAHLLRLINTGINNYLHVGLDGHAFKVISADYTPIEPFWTDNLVIAVGKFSRLLHLGPFHFPQHALCNTPPPRICSHDNYCWRTCH
jgi:FtsP/CotA-like multicopper oxidase with cupredoxin domain